MRLPQVLLSVFFFFFFAGKVSANTDLIQSDNTADFNIAVLDMHEYYNPSTRNEFVAKMSEALQEVGFFAVINARIDNEIVDKAYSASKEFFSLNYGTKKKCEMLTHSRQRGYAPIGEDIPGGHHIADFKEFYHVGRELTEEQKKRLGYFANIWPEDMLLGKPMVALYKELEAYVLPLQHAFAQAIDQDYDIFTDMTREGDSLLRMIHFPYLKKDGRRGRVWSKPHTDIDLFTILPRATAIGLQIQMKDGNWATVSTPPNAFIVSAGNMLENITNGYFRSAVHRVVALADHRYERFSMAFYVHPRSDVNLEPLPTCVALTGGKKLYAKASRWELLMEKLTELGLATPDLLQELADSELMERQIEVGRVSVGAMKQLKENALASPTVLRELEKRDED
ncbi:MAG: isopenicillin N synthase-like dioxygenase [Chlamydiales bacterium]|jgi:isopenicillin N synthase-like dioxygenase